ncbi:E3 ubiquitin-protein ligase TRIM38-like isoform X2 [Cavia porcellus]|uniref:Tripartite motif containing 38 n=1 Tax=Cavia porcellus TaxID=10141 RepID=A0A286Y1X8_CAVPO|nr:E3 ubiquitin-protein ligase TRIM38-like isoform X2 [Cavia porcellus]
MSSTTIIRKIKAIATCSMCKKVMLDPVSISCGHSYCRRCIRHFCKNQTINAEWSGPVLCPLCLKPIKVKNIYDNKQLASLIELISEVEKTKETEETERERVCEAHKERLQLFCEDDGQLICWRCERTPQHRGHATELVEDVYQGYKEKLEEAARNLNELQQECTNETKWVTTQINYWKQEVETQKQKIKSDFKRLQTFLHEEEKLYLWRLEKEEEQMLRRLRESEANLEQKSEELKSHILELKAKCQGSAQNLLQDVKETLSRTWAVKLEAPEVFNLEVHTSCSVAELYLDVKTMLRRHQVNVTGDPDTAHPALTLSEEQRQVSEGSSQQNPEVCSGRITAFPHVMGCEGFTSGRHFFEVDVGEGTAWDVGVCLNNVELVLSMKQEAEFESWTIRRCTEGSYIALTSPTTALELFEQPQVVGIVLDYEAGVVSFYNMTTGSHIFTFPKASFSGTLRPYFQVYQHSPLFLPLTCE